MRDYTQPSLEMLESRTLLSALPLGQVAGEAPAEALGSSIMAQAQQVTFHNGRGSIRGSLLSGNPSDTYGFVASRDGILRLQTGGKLALQLTGYDDQGNALATDAVPGGNHSLRFRVASGQRYFVRLGAAQDTAGRFSIAVSTGKDDAGDSAASAASAAANSGGVGRIRGQIDWAGDTDVFAVTAKVGGMVSLVPSLIAGGLDCQVTVTDAAGNVIGQTAQGRANVVFSVAAGGVYYVKIAASQAGIGRYQYSVTLDTKAVPVVPLVLPDSSGQNIAPGSTFSAGEVNMAGGTQLLLLGTDQADNVTVSQSGSAVTVVCGGYSQTFSGNYIGITTYGFGGGDTFNFMYSLSLPVYVDTGSGSDTIYMCASGRSEVLCGDGDNTIIDVGGAGSTVVGGAGLDSFWVDSKVTLSGTTDAEQAAGSIHRIGELYQPVTTSKTSPGYITLQAKGQNLPDPQVTSDAKGWRNYSDKPLFTGAPTYSDIAQGYVGDCYFLASLASLAQANAGAIQQMITGLGDGTYLVRFFSGSGSAAYVRVDGDLPVDRDGNLAYAGLGHGGDTWAALIEKAYAFFRTGGDSYDSISGGWMSEALRAATGNAPVTHSPSSLSGSLFGYLQDQLSQGNAVTLGSSYFAPAPVVGGHAYMVQRVYQDGSGQHIVVYNPWGVDGYSPGDDNFYDGLVTLTPAQVLSCYTTITCCAA